MHAGVDVCAITALNRTLCLGNRDATGAAGKAFAMTQPPASMPERLLQVAVPSPGHLEDPVLLQPKDPRGQPQEVLQGPTRVAHQVQTRAVLQVPPKAVLQVPPKAVLQVPPKAVPQVPTRVVRQAQPKVVLQVPPKAARQVPPKAARQVPPKAARQAPPKAARQVPPKAALQAPPKAVPQVPTRVVRQAQPKVVPQVPTRVVRQAQPKVVLQVPTRVVRQAQPKVVLQIPTRAVLQVPTKVVLQVQGGTPPPTRTPAAAGVSTDAAAAPGPGQGNNNTCCAIAAPANCAKAEGCAWQTGCQLAWDVCGSARTDKDCDAHLGCVWRKQNTSGGNNNSNDGSCQSVVDVCQLAGSSLAACMGLTDSRGVPVCLPRQGCRQADPHACPIEQQLYAGCDMAFDVCSLGADSTTCPSNLGCQWSDRSTQCTSLSNPCMASTNPSSCTSVGSPLPVCRPRFACPGQGPGQAPGQAPPQGPGQGPPQGPGQGPGSQPPSPNMGAPPGQDNSQCGKRETLLRCGEDSGCVWRDECRSLGDDFCLKYNSSSACTTAGSPCVWDVAHPAASLPVGSGDAICRNSSNTCPQYSPQDCPSPACTRRAFCAPQAPGSPNPGPNPGPGPNQGSGGCDYQGCGMCASLANAIDNGQVNISLARDSCLAGSNLLTTVPCDFVLAFYNRSRDIGPVRSQVEVCARFFCQGCPPIAPAPSPNSYLNNTGCDSRQDWCCQYTSITDCPLANCTWGGQCLPANVYTRPQDQQRMHNMMPAADALVAQTFVPH
eukprot:jgi/Chlat1/4678/Chrsp3S05642